MCSMSVVTRRYYGGCLHEWRDADYEHFCSNDERSVRLGTSARQMKQREHSEIPTRHYTSMLYPRSLST